MLKCTLQLLFQHVPPSVINATPPLPRTYSTHTNITHTPAAVYVVGYSWLQEGKAGGRLWVCGLHCKPNPSHPASPRCVSVRAPNHILMYGQASQGERSRLRRVWVECLGQSAPFRFSPPQISAVPCETPVLWKSLAIGSSCLHLGVKGHSTWQTV